MKHSGGLRQRMFPGEFRIPEAPWPEDTIAQLERIAEQITKHASAEKSREDLQSSAGHKAFLADVGTGLWRLRQKMTQPGTDKPLEEMRRAYRHFESVWDALERDGVKIYDHTGEDFDAGRSIKVLAYQPTAGLSRERVTETIKPTIYVNDERVQMGEVIVGTPEG
jgi:hypothetical protein